RITFEAAEPSTASLLLLAVGAFGLQAWGRVRREERPRPDSNRRLCHAVPICCKQ
ncbi:MAG: PEP-CTERM sorting domain-containing protein, partial [Gammaproteobacteria bacterium]|nr:PEP-CTERM sorting domain-containing protein [Gammaproteobacteria bacterium]